MFFGASANIFRKAEILRKKMNPAETQIWDILKLNPFDGYKFRRQHPMGPYIADFYCHKLKLVIELDGKHHQFNKSQFECDKEREDIMKNWGIKTLRYTNELGILNSQQIFTDIEKFIWTHENPPAPQP